MAPSAARVSPPVWHSLADRRRAADYIDLYRPFWTLSADRLAEFTVELERADARATAGAATEPG